MFYKGQIDAIAASLENELHKDGFKVTSIYNPSWAVLSNGTFGIEIKDGVDQIYFNIVEENSNRNSHISLKNYHSVKMMTNVVRMAFDEIALGLNKIKSCGCPIKGPEVHQEGCDLYRQNDYSKKIANQFTAKYEKDSMRSKSIAATQNARFNYHSIGEW